MKKIGTTGRRTFSCGSVLWPKKRNKKSAKGICKGRCSDRSTNVAETTAAPKLGEADLETKIDYYIAKGEITLSQAGKIWVPANGRC